MYSSTHTTHNANTCININLWCFADLDCFSGKSNDKRWIREHVGVGQPGYFYAGCTLQFCHIILPSYNYCYIVILVFITCCWGERWKEVM